MTTPATNLYDYSQRELAELLAAWGESPVHAARLWGCLYRERVTDLGQLPELPARLRARLGAETRLPQLTPVRETHSNDGQTRKFLLELAGGQQIETVLMQFRGRTTACLSSQAGCALGCVFCATGQQGFSRNLAAGEIVAQAIFAQRASTERLRNLVLMGMGEPLLNYDAVLQALDILRDPAGMAIGAKQITISTVGVVPGILRLADEGRPFSLAVSLHAATQDERLALVPAAATWPLDVLLDACRYYAAKTGRRIFFEWTLIAGTNDSPEQARAVADLLTEVPAQVNLIPLNPTTGYDGIAGRPDAARRFQAILHERGIPATIRQRRGIDIAAGCGQLAGA